LLPQVFHQTHDALFSYSGDQAVAEEKLIRNGEIFEVSYVA
jgi:hypothetical protein